MAWRQWCGGLISFYGEGVEVMSLFMGFRRGFVHGFLWGLLMGFRRLGRIWVAFGLAFRWLDLGPVVVIFSDGLGDLF